MNICPGIGCSFKRPMCEKIYMASAVIRWWKMMIPNRYYEKVASCLIYRTELLHCNICRWFINKGTDELYFIKRVNIYSRKTKRIRCQSIIQNCNFNTFTYWHHSKSKNSGSNHRKIGTLNSASFRYVCTGSFDMTGAGKEREITNNPQCAASRPSTESRNIYSLNRRCRDTWIFTCGIPEALCACDMVPSWLWDAARVWKPQTLPRSGFLALDHDLDARHHRLICRAECPEEVALRWGEVDRVSRRCGARPRISACKESTSIEGKEVLEQNVMMDVLHPCRDPKAPRWRVDLYALWFYGSNLFSMVQGSKNRQSKPKSKSDADGAEDLVTEVGWFGAGEVYLQCGDESQVWLSVKMQASIKNACDIRFREDRDRLTPVCANRLESKKVPESDGTGKGTRPHDSKASGFCVGCAWNQNNM